MKGILFAKPPYWVKTKELCVCSRENISLKSESVILSNDYICATAEHNHKAPFRIQSRVRRARSPSPSKSWQLRYLKDHTDLAKILCLENDTLQHYLSPSCVQSLSGVQLFVTLWTAACQASCPSLSPGVCSNSYPLSQWCHPTISSSVAPFSSCPQSFPTSESFPMSPLFFGTEVPKYWSFSFSISPSNEHSGLISFRVDRVDWLDLLAILGTLKSSPTPQFKSINSLALSLLYGRTLTSVHDYWKNHSFDNMDLCQQSDVSAF